MKQWTAIGITTAALAFGAQLAQAQQTTIQVTITDLPLLPGGTYASAYAINDTGKIVGVANDSTGAFKNVQWLNGQISIIPDYSASGLSVPDDINDAGEIAGHVSISGFFSYAVWWDSLNNPIALPGLPSGSAAQNLAHAINASGHIVGQARESGPNFYVHGAVWYQGALQTDLGPSTEAFGINDLGDVVGISSTSGSTHAFLWRNGQFTDLSTWSGSGPFSKAYAINHNGLVVGMNSNVASYWENGAVHALTMPAGVSAFTSAVDVNDAGDIIATGPTLYPDEVGVLWHNGTPINLGTLPGGTISRARRINEHGEIVGEAKAANGFFHAVKWTISTPSTTFCAGDGAAACPCGNAGAAGNGCAHSSNASGANLAGTGIASLAGDTFALTSSGMPNGPALYFQGTTQLNGGAGFSFGDGLRCAGGTVIRLGTKTNVLGASRYPVGGDAPISAKGLVSAAGTRTYQVWYRDSDANFCTPTTFNLSNGLSVAWTP